jgi:hypothetical protein
LTYWKERSTYSKASSIESEPDLILFAHPSGSSTLSSVSPQIHTLLTAAATAADAGHIEDANVLLQEALDHDFMADIAMALHALENEATKTLPFDLRPYLGQLVRIPAAKSGTYDAGESDPAGEDDDFDFFGSELVVDVEEIDSDAQTSEPPLRQDVNSYDEIDPYEDSVMTLDDDDLEILPNTVPVPTQSPLRGSEEETDEVEPAAVDMSDLNLSANTFKEMDDLAGLDELFDDTRQSKASAASGNFSFGGEPEVEEDDDSDMDAPAPNTSAPGGRARYAASAPAPPPPSHRRASVATGDVSVPPGEHSDPGDWDRPTVLPKAPSHPPRHRATSEASPAASIAYNQEHDDLDDFDLFGDSPPPTKDGDSPPVTSPVTRQTSMATLSGLPSRVQGDTNPSGLATVTNENQGSPIEFDSPAVSGVNSTLFKGRPPSPRSDFAGSRRANDTGSRRTIHGAGTYHGGGTSEDTGIKRRTEFKVTPTTTLKKRPLTREQRQILTPRSMFLYDQVDGMATVEDLVDISGLSLEEAMLIIEQLVHDNMVEVL